jgi:hypothetical protein
MKPTTHTPGNPPPRHVVFDEQPSTIPAGKNNEERRALFLIAGATLLALAAIATATLIALDRLTATLP